MLCPTYVRVSVFFFVRASVPDINPGLIGRRQSPTVSSTLRFRAGWEKNKHGDGGVRARRKGRRDRTRRRDEIDGEGKSLARTRERERKNGGGSSVAAIGHQSVRQKRRIRPALPLSALREEKERERERFAERDTRIFSASGFGLMSTIQRHFAQSSRRGLRVRIVSRFDFHASCQRTAVRHGTVNWDSCRVEPRRR